MWTLAKKFTFEAAHQLPHHEGKCRRLHGHSWVGYVYVAGDSLIESGSQSGMVIDYGEIKAKLQPLVKDYLDHYYLNETTQMENPTSEAIAQWIYKKLKPSLPGLIAVRIDETCTSRCIYTESSHPSGFASDEAFVG